MSRKAGIRAAALGVLLTLVLASVAGASGSAPTLLSPNGKSVSPGRIRLVVNVPLTPRKGGVFIAIQPNRKLNQGHLSGACSKGCDFVGPKHLKGHKYSYVSQFNFTGYWSVTPGKYYWQAHYYTLANVYYSKIGTFTVR